ncbi:SMP-30/gluconolactonase/LRE family protein [Nisaea acidiphila]|uniref:SMP-30/gluconolactonase/LRE family protein n=1 Tax=Nisaea acidiphila TaxID=1862145 RepID=A0A9J7ASJ8_9PROT|nr:SMP-30/gluconolactonase/LRE family protein [Nisaea acidiphila]UUX50158.1 SMP-30/gluconolactonase/LRE family protein [Nisaea acidiphila]
MPVTVDCVLKAKAKLGEGAVWDSVSEVLWWVDIAAPALHSFSPGADRAEVWKMPSAIGCVAPRRGGGAILGLEDGWSAFDPATGAISLLNNRAPGRPTHRFNDGCVDPNGRFWAGTMPKTGPRDSTAGETGDGELFCLEADGSCRCELGELYIQNGLAFSPDGRRMYLSDSYPMVRTIWRFDYDQENGVPSNRQVFFDTRAVPGRPDGAAMDADGCYWMAGVDGWQILRLTPDGRIDRTIPVPVEKPTCLAFGGPDLTDLYITCMGPGLITPGTEDRQPDAGGLFVCTPGVAGYAPPPAAA